ncbi:MAG TPA: DUF6665 family protein [Rhizobiaceae bacterium]|nr:DUF6665 family protein [Rhizobiaceae bacterium]
MSTLYLPGAITAIASGKSSIDLLEYEMMAEKASSLGRAGHKVEQVMAELKAFDGGPEARLPIVKRAAEAVYAYFIQRELCGFRRHNEIIREYQIPNEVLARLGAR